MNNINNYYFLLSKSEKMVFHSLEKLDYKVLNMTLEDLSTFCCVSTATINRTIRKLKFKNLKDYKEYVNYNIENKLDNLSKNKYYSTLYNILNLENYNYNSIQSIIKEIKKSNNIYIVAFGVTSSIGLEFSLNLNKLGYNSIFMGVPEIFDSINNNKDDIIIFISFAGIDIDMEKLSIDQKNSKKLILITSNPKSSIAENCKIVLNTNTYKNDNNLNSRLPLNILTTKIIIELMYNEN